MQLLGTWKRPTATLRGLRRYGKRVTVQLPFQPPFVILSRSRAEIKELFTAPPDAVHPGEGARILEPIVGRNSVILLDEERPPGAAQADAAGVPRRADGSGLAGLMSELDAARDRHLAAR